MSTLSTSSSEGSDSDPPAFESILGERIGYNGELQYDVKWKNRWPNVWVWRSGLLKRHKSLIEDYNKRKALAGENLTLPVEVQVEKENINKAGPSRLMKRAGSSREVENESSSETTPSSSSKSALRDTEGSQTQPADMEKMSTNDRKPTKLRADGTYKRGFTQIEKIISKRLKNNKAEYFIKWEGYDDNYTSWTAEEHLEKCFPKYLKKFEEEQNEGIASQRSGDNLENNVQLENNIEVEEDKNIQPNTIRQSPPNNKGKSNEPGPSSSRTTQKSTLVPIRRQRKLDMPKENSRRVTRSFSTETPSPSKGRFRNRQPERIIGAQGSQQRRHVLIKLKDSNVNMWVPFEKIKNEFPLMIFSFIPRIIQWLRVFETKIAAKQKEGILKDHTPQSIIEAQILGGERMCLMSYGGRHLPVQWVPIEEVKPELVLAFFQALVRCLTDNGETNNQHDCLVIINPQLT